jgi:hypothetical protein
MTKIAKRFPDFQTACGIILSNLLDYRDGGVPHKNYSTYTAERLNNFKSVRIAFSTVRGYSKAIQQMMNDTFEELETIDGYRMYAPTFSQTLGQDGETVHVKISFNKK